MKILIARTAALLAAVALATTAAVPQRVPYRERPAPYEQYDNRDRDRGDRNQAGAFDYYVLALSWSPTYCAERRGDGDEPQCDVRRARPYAFVLHGLWPQHERGWPSNCRSSDRGWVPGPVAERMLDIMPSKRLVFNEYRKHGTCSGLGVDGYFDLARRLHDKVQIPKRFNPLTDDRLLVSPGELIDDFLAANPELKPDMIAVQCGGSGNRLREVRICFDKGGNFRACGSNENQRRLCSVSRMYVPPVRGGRTREEPDRPSGPVREIVPLPK
jgi:ribonuclease T2